MELNLPGTIDQRYTVEEVIGSGAMATVYSATDNRLGRQVALKVLRPDIARDEASFSRFAREGESVASLNHPGIVAVYDTGKVNVPDEKGSIDVPYLVMELVRGKSLREMMRSGGISTKDASIFGVQLLEALAYSHSKGIIHRDIKPANLMVLDPTDDDRQRGIPGQLKVMDFGIARVAEGEPLTQVNTVIGTPRYISPEHARGAQVDERSDVYSAAVVLYEMLAGRAPFAGDVVNEIISQHLSEEPKAPSFYAKQQIPAELDRVVLKALSKDPAQRYQDAEHFRNALAHATRGILPQSVLDDIDNEPVTSAMSTATAVGAGAVAASNGKYSVLDTQSTPQAPVEDAGLGGFFAGAQSEYSDEEVMEYGRDSEVLLKNRRKRAWGRFLSGLVIFLLAASCIGLILYYQNKLNEVPTVAVPSVTGMSREEAENSLRNAGLQLEFEETFSDKVEKGQAIGTDPIAGTAIDEGSVVKLNMSKGNEMVKVPTGLNGQSEAYVREALTNADFKPGRTSMVNNPTVPAGMVVGVKPGEGESVKAESTIDIILSTGKVEVPSLVGLTRDEAIAALTGPDVLLSTNIENVQTDDAPAGTVMSQSAAAGTSIEQGSTVTIRIANAPAPQASASAAPAPSAAASQQANNNQANQNTAQAQPSASAAPSAATSAQPSAQASATARSSARPSASASR